MNGLLPRILLATILTTASALHAQQANPDAGFVAPKQKKTKIDTSAIEKPSTVDVTGVVKQAADMRKPLQLINPFAPEKYGDGSQDVSWDPDNQDKPKGIILFGLQW